MPRASEGTRGREQRRWLGRGSGRSLARSQSGTLGHSQLLRWTVQLRRALPSGFGGFEREPSPFARVRSLHNLQLSAPWLLIAVRYLTETVSVLQALVWGQV